EHDPVPAEHVAVVNPVVGGQSGECRTDRSAIRQLVQPIRSDCTAVCQVEGYEDGVHIATTQDSVGCFGIAVDVELRGGRHVSVAECAAHHNDPSDFVP